MAQHDYVIANDTAANVRSDLNDALSAIVSQNSGATAPSTTYANMLWYDTANNILNIRSEADDAWINVGYFDQSANAFRILDDTQVVNTSGTQTGLLGDQSEATWETGTSTTESLVSPAKVKAAVEANAESPVKAWVNFDGTGTVSIRESFNVSSITDNGAGDYTVNFDTALTDANYVVAGMSARQDTNQGITIDGTNTSGTPKLMTATQCRVIVGASAQGAKIDNETITLAFFR